MVKPGDSQFLQWTRLLRDGSSGDPRPSGRLLEYITAFQTAAQPAAVDEDMTQPAAAPSSLDPSPAVGPPRENSAHDPLEGLHTFASLPYVEYLYPNRDASAASANISDDALGTQPEEPLTHEGAGSEPAPSSPGMAYLDLRREVKAQIAAGRLH